MTTIDSFSGEYRFLSNFYPAPVNLYGTVYPTSEHAYQAGKTLSLEERQRIASLETAGQAKRAGRELTMRADWEDHKQQWMRTVLTRKFSQNLELADKLVDTGDALLIEGNTWHDQIWGSCNCPKHIAVPGENLLGKALMDLRTELKENS